MSKSKFDCNIRGTIDFHATVIAPSAAEAKRIVRDKAIIVMGGAVDRVYGRDELYFDFEDVEIVTSRKMPERKARKPSTPDATVLRQVLDQHKVFNTWYGHTGKIFNDKRKDGTRRLKLWVATALHHVPRKVQHTIDKEIRDAFGDRFIRAYFIKNEGLWNGWSFCVELMQ